MRAVLVISHPLLFEVSLLLLLILLAAVHSLEILLHLHALEVQVKRIDARLRLLHEAGVWLRLRFWVLHVLEKCTVVILVLAEGVLEVHRVDLRLSRGLSLMGIRTGVEEHGKVVTIVDVVAIELLL